MPRQRTAATVYFTASLFGETHDLFGPPQPAAALNDWLDWQQRLASQKASGLSVEVYCL